MDFLSRFPSYDLVAKSAVRTAVRFPLTLVSALVGCVAAILMVELDHDAGGNTVQKLMIVASMGLPLFTALTTFAEKQRLRLASRFSIEGLAVVLLTIYYFSMPEAIIHAEVHLVRALLLNIGFHFLVSFAPFLGRQQAQGFWQYNKTLFLRVLTSALYSGVLYLGLTIALAAADHLFGVDVKADRYGELWIIIVAVFNTWFFLAGIPEDLDALNHREDYPKGIKVFTQFILLPLVALYFLILITYEAKIIITWNWPRGWVSQLVLWYSVVGILSLLLLHPLKEKVGNKWMLAFSKWFFRGLIPLVVMLFLSISVRIQDYGITENRYFVLGMAIGLTVVVLYFVFRKAGDIRIVPIVLCLMSLLSAYGPWSAFSVSKASQKGRLETYLTQNGMLINGTLQAAPDEISFEDAQEMSSIVKYLNDWHGLPSFADWLSDSVVIDLDLDSSGVETIALELGFEYVSPYTYVADSGGFSFHAEKDDVVDVAGYDHLIAFYSIAGDDWDHLGVVTGDSCYWQLEENTAVINVRFGTLPAYYSYVRMDLQEPISSLVESMGHHSENVVIDRLSFDFSEGEWDVRIVFDILSGAIPDDSVQLNSGSGHLLVRDREKDK